MEEPNLARIKKENDVAQEDGACGISLGNSEEKKLPLDADCADGNTMTDPIIPMMDGILPDQILEEEKRLEDENSILVVETQPVEDEVKITLEERYLQLQKLLQRSKFYSRYLSQKIQETGPRASDVTTGRSSKRRKLAPLKEFNDNSPKVLSCRTRHEQKRIKTKECKVVLKDYRLETSKENKNSSNKRPCTPESEEEVPMQETTAMEQPLLFTGGEMRSYQLEGLNWLRLLYDNGLNGILGDEMGLGKTIQCIGLIAYFIDQNIKGPFIVCAPLSTLPNWISEFKKFTPKIPVILYHGPQAERRKLLGQLKKQVRIDATRCCFPVIITSYEVAISDRNLLRKYKWKYLIVDEGQRIKNMHCLLIKCLKDLSTANRLLLTGTPLQNSLAELWSLLNFLLPELFHKLDIFESWFDISSMMKEGSEAVIIEQERDKHIIATLREILAPFLLRRVKSEVELNLPPKREFLVYASLTPKQSQFYKAIVNKTIADLVVETSAPEENVLVNSNLEKDLQNTELKLRSSVKSAPVYAGPMMKTTVTNFSYKSRLMDLRKCVNHPYLIEYPLDLETEDYLVDENIVLMSGKLVVLDILLKELIPNNHKVLIFSQMVEMLNILHDFCYLRSYQFRRLDGSRSLDERMQAIAEFNNDPEISVFLISTRAGGLGLNLAAADTVILYDSDWNPQCDLQAMDRCHRIGQTKPVIIYRFVVAGCIDEHMVKRAAAKRKLEKMIIHNKDMKSNKHTYQEKKFGFSMAELLALLKSEDHNNIVYTNEHEVLSKTELDLLLDRSFGHEEQVTNTANSRVQILENIKVE